MEVKMKTLKKLTVIIIIFFVSASTMFAQTYVSGIIPNNTTWTLVGSPYIVIGGVLVSSGVTLTIEPGVEVKFDSELSLQIDGKLITIGTESNMITFTSNNDSPEPGDWGYIFFSDISTDAIYDTSGNYTDGCIMEYCIIEYAGGANVDNNGAVRMYNAHPFINHSIICYNSAPGICAWNFSENIKIFNCDICNNYGDSGNGGGIYVNNGASDWASLTILNSNIYNNYVDYGNGGGIYLNGNGAFTAIISECNISNNYADGYTNGNGGGIYLNDGVSIIISDCNISNNSSTDPGGGGGGSGGGVYVNSSPMTITNSIISNNSADYGGGIYYSSTWNTTITNNSIVNNSAVLGGGIYYISSGNVTNNNIIGNLAQNAAAIYCYSGEDLKFNTITGNIATGSEPTYSIYVNWHPLFNYNNILNNTATYDLWNNNPQGSNNVDAINNWWGTANESEIEEKIWDWFDDSSLGIVDFNPYLTSPDIDAPPIPPFGLYTLAVGYDYVTINWQNSPIGDLAGYKVYFDSDSTGFPYAETVDVGMDTTYTLTDLITGTTYYIAVTCYDNSGEESWYSNEIEITPGGVGVEENLFHLPNSFYLSQNYPNPFNHKTTISFTNSKESNINISIYNIKGQKVKTLVNENLQRGNHEVIWNGKNEKGEAVSSGIYFCKMTGGSKAITKKILLVK